jgi:Domain of unknown function (DUF4158)
MPRRELLTPTERVQLFAFPEEEGELIRLATLACADLTYIRQHCGDHNRLGLAIQMLERDAAVERWLREEVVPDHQEY